MGLDLGQQLWGSPYQSYGNVRKSGEILRQFCLRLMRTFAPVATGLAVAGFALGAHAADGDRTLRFYNIHTKEKVTITYKRDGKFDPEGMKQINHIMRDWRRDEPTKMDPELIDTIWQIYQDVGAEKPIHLVSGYRSRKTNESLRRRRGGQARKSQHILGKAADLHFPDVPVKKLRNSALVRQVGGVGYYPKSGLPFVHVDTGRVRHWPRIGRQELALLFPDGKTKHVPSDGRPLTKRDGAIALAKLDKKIDSFIAKKSKVKLPPKMMMAGFTPPSLKWPKASPETTASIPAEKAPVPPRKTERLAALPAPSAIPARKPVRILAPAPAPQPKPRIALSPVDEAEHPEELTYAIHSVVALLGDAEIASDRHLATLVAPGQDEENYLLREREDTNVAALMTGLGYAQQVKSVAFVTPESTQKPIRTASR